MKEQPPTSSVSSGTQSLGHPVKETLRINKLKLSRNRPMLTLTNLVDKSVKAENDVDRLGLINYDVLCQLPEDVQKAIMYCDFSDLRTLRKAIIK
jgi:hypothetical protein